MVKLVFCLKRREGLTREEFQRYWREDHAALVRRYADVLGIRRYVQVHTLDTPFNEIVIDSRQAPEEYDGVAELYWDDFDAMVNAGSTEEGMAAAEALTEDERGFIDHSRSPIFFAEVLEIIGDGGS